MCAPLRVYVTLCIFSMFPLLLPPQTWLHPCTVKIKEGGSNLTGFLYDEVFALWMLWAPVSARTPETELPWQAASRISPLTRRADNYCLRVSACVWVGGWRACPRRVAEHLLGPAPTNQASDVWWQWKIPPEQVWDSADSEQIQAFWLHLWKHRPRSQSSPVSWWFVLTCTLSFVFPQRWCCKATVSRV